MSDQRKYRSELRQGLHQFLMQLYMSYMENHSEDDAKRIISEEIERQYQYFSPEGIQVNSAEEAIKNKIAEISQVLEDTSDYDTQLYYAEKVDSLSAALEILKT